jgi:hypothetical protein
MGNIERLFQVLIKWLDWLLLFARKYANYLALIFLLVAGSKMFKLNVKANVGKE